MGRRHEWAFSPGRHTYGQNTHETMLNIANQRNVSKNHNEVSPHICQNGYRQKGYKQLTRWRGCEGKGILAHHCWEYKVAQPLWKTICRFLEKLKIELPYD